MVVPGYHFVEAGRRPARPPSIFRSPQSSLHLDDVGGGEVENLGEYRVLVAEQSAAGNEARRKTVGFYLRLAGGEPPLRFERKKHVAQLGVFVCAGVTGRNGGHVTERSRGDGEAIDQKNYDATHDDAGCSGEYSQIKYSAEPDDDFSLHN